MADLIERLRGRASGYRDSGPSASHTAILLEEAANHIDRLRSELAKAEKDRDEAQATLNEQRLKPGVRWVIAHLHKRAARMNHYPAKQWLNSLGFELGVRLNHYPIDFEAALDGAEEMREITKEQFLEDTILCAADTLDIYNRVHVELDDGRPYEDIDNGMINGGENWPYDVWLAYMQARLIHSLEDIVVAQRDFERIANPVLRHKSKEGGE